MHKQVVFFGSSPFSNIVLQKLIDAQVVVAVVTKADKPVGRHMEITPNPVKVLAEKNNIPVVDVIPANSIGLVAAYGKIIPQSALDTFNGQIYNIHPSLLPKYRGPSPLQQQILDGVTETGVSVIKLDAEMDHGPLIAQKKSILKNDETWISLGERLFSAGADLFNDVILSEVKNPGFGSFATAQDDKLATYTKKITRQDGFVEWADFKPEKLAIKLRAFADWPGVWTLAPNGRRLKLTTLRPIIQVQEEGKKPQSWSNYAK